MPHRRSRALDYDTYHLFGSSVVVQFIIGPECLELRTEVHQFSNDNFPNISTVDPLELSRSESFAPLNEQLKAIRLLIMEVT